MSGKTAFDINELFKEGCMSVCGPRKAISHFSWPRDDMDENKKWGYLAENVCMKECPFEKIRLLLAEERDQNMKLELEYDLEVV